MSGQSVKVTRKSGSVSTETLGAMVKQIGQLWFYATR
jgi:hypothetical protein